MSRFAATALNSLFAGLVAAAVWSVPAGAAPLDDDEAGDDSTGRVVGFPFRFGLFGGWQFTSADFDVLGQREFGLVPGEGPHFGVRAGWRVVRAFTLELEAGLVMSPIERDDATAWLLPVHLQVQWRPLESTTVATPVLGLGAGLFALLPGPAGSDVDFLATATGGFEVELGPTLALRLTAGVHVTDGVTNAVSFSPVVSFGIDFKTFVDSSRRSRATADPNDPASEPLIPIRLQRPSARPLPPGCPPGVPESLCTDSDGDLLIDAFDHCPLEAADTSDGCPDPDGDGVFGLDDACPKTPGPASHHGCPAPR